MKKVIIAVAIAAALTGCGTTQLVDKKSEWIQGSENVDKSMAPEWFTMHLANDTRHIFATSTEYSADYQFAIDKAMLAAKANLAAQVNQRIKMTTKSKISEEGNATDIDDIERATERTTESIVDTTTLVGYKRDKLEVRREGRGFRVFLRLVYDFTDGNAISQNAMREEKRKAKQQAKEKQSSAVVTPILPHETISDAKVKKQVQDAIARGDAIIMTETIR